MKPLATLLGLLLSFPVISQNAPVPADHRFSSDRINKPENFKQTRYATDTFELVYDLIEMVDTGEFMPSIRHLSGYSTRFCNAPEAFQAQEWIQEKFESYDLETEIQDFPCYMGDCSDNVIAVLPGTVYPDEYIVTGAHYDSFSFGATAPGADDNASGTSAVIELARILSGYSFERSIVFCAFSAEEIGLVGSEYYASQAQMNGMNILGYFNFDMIGYLHPGETIHTDMIAPASAQELVDYYKDVVSIYMPDFPVYDATFTGGDSDHTSFNNNGYMGIFPFEDVPNYSPYIHTPQDLIGPSFNSSGMAARFIQANLASVSSLSGPVESVSSETRKPVSAGIMIYPNPAGSMVTFRIPDGCSGQIDIISAEGKKIRSFPISGQYQLSLSGIPAGFYTVQWVSDEQITFQQLIVLQR